MLRVASCFTVLLVAVYAREEPELKCPPSSGSTTTARLRSELFCDYNSYIRPVKDHRNTTTVYFRLLLKYFQYDHFSHMLSVDAWFPVFWTDQHLRWTPEDYDGIKTVHLSSLYDIWVPDISVYNRKDQSSEPKIIGDTTCAVNYYGTVLCVPPLHFDSLCVPNLKKYPYDTQTCTVRFGSWVHKGEELNFSMIDPVISKDDLEPNGEWELVSFKGVANRGNYSCCPNSTYPSIDIVLEIKRNHHSHAVDTVLPLIVCILLTLATMAMSPLNKDRFILSCVALITHIFHLQNMSYAIPYTGENMPSLMAISRDSTLLAGFSIIATVLLKNIMQSKWPNLQCLSTLSSFLTSSRAGQIIFLRDKTLKGAAEAEKQDDSETIISNMEIPSTSVTSDWYIFAKLLDICLFIIYVMVYFIIIVKF